MREGVSVKSASGEVFNARADVGDGFIIFHSRSGKERNRDYRPALETILERLDAAQFAYEVYLDSQPAQMFPKEKRRLTFARSGPVPDRFNELVRAMNADGSSHGAYKRIRLEVAHCSASQLTSLLKEGAAKAQRLSAAQLRMVTPEQIDEAVARLLAGADAPNFKDSTSYDLLSPDGTRLAPKKVFGLALEMALGIEAMPIHFTAGHGNAVFQLLEAAGYPVVAKGEPEDDQIVESVDPWWGMAEGSPKLRSHLKRERKPALAKAKKRDMIQRFGRLFCDRCDVDASSLGPNGDAAIEVHHARTQVSEMEDGHVTRLSDLQCLCANCHRIVHREIKLADKERVATKGKAA